MVASELLKYPSNVEICNRFIQTMVLARPDLRMKVRITKRPPAPLMDGFMVGHLESGRVYAVDEKFATYLILAGYAVPAQPVAGASQADDGSGEGDAES